MNATASGFLGEYACGLHDSGELEVGVPLAFKRSAQPASAGGDQVSIRLVHSNK